jgi:hypothetical protein
MEKMMRALGEVVYTSEEEFVEIAREAYRRQREISPLEHKAVDWYLNGTMQDDERWRAAITAFRESAMMKALTEVAIERRNDERRSDSEN